jgi:hypothetical protein
MQFIRFSLFFLFNGLAHGQVVSKDHKMGYVLVDNDEVVSDTIQLEEIIVSKEKLISMLKRFLLCKQSLYNLSVCHWLLKD